MKIIRLRCVWVLLLVTLFCGTGLEAYGQDKVRTYANFQGSYEAGINLLGLLTGVVSDGSNAIDHNVKTFSTLSVPVGVLGLLSATQYLEFTSNGQHSTVRTIPANTSVTVKTVFAKEVLGLLSGVEIGYFSDLKPVNGGLLNRAGYNTDKRFPVYTGASLLNLLNGAGEFEVTFSPPQTYNGVYIKLSGNGLSVLLTNNVFHAYITENGTIPNCSERNNPIDILSGVRSASIGALTSLGGVANPYNLLNSDLTDFATMNVGVGALNTVFLNTVFPTDSKLPQIVKIILDQPNNLLDLNLLGGFTIQPYSRSTPIGSPISSNNFLKIRLLPGTQKYELYLKVNNPFDRVEIRLDNTINLLTSLRVYNVSRHEYLELIPEVDLDGRVTECEIIDLSSVIVSYDDTKYNYSFYTQEIGGASVSGIITRSGIYYIEAKDKVTGCSSLRLPVVANILPLPGKPHLTISDVIN